MNNTLLSSLAELLDAEVKSEELRKIPKSLYRDVAAEIRRQQAAVKDNRDLAAKVAEREKGLVQELASRLLSLRFKKGESLLDEGLDEQSLTDEEKYLFEPLLLARRRLMKVDEAIKRGRTVVLDAVSEAVASRTAIVQFTKPTPSFVGIDLKRYGPFETGDVAVLPRENFRPLARQGVVREVWVEEAP